MGLSHKIHRIKRVPKAKLPSLVAFKSVQWARAQAERFLFPVSGPRFPRRPLPIRPVRLFHFEAPQLPQMRELFPSETDAVMSAAEDAVTMNVDALWHTDPQSGHTWDPKAYFKDIHYADTPGADIKVPWELSRCQHFVTLAQAFALTKDQKYARAFFEQTLSWIDKNPPKRGVNWVCAMDVALRACNWLAAWDMFQGSSTMPIGFRDAFSVSLQEHGEHLSNYLEWGAGVSTNHYLSDLLGLFYIGVALDKKSWIALSQKELGREIFNQTYEDGFSYEGSTAYHRLVLEIFFYYARVCERNPERAAPLGAVFLERLDLMTNVVEQLSAYDGTIPMIGDNDSGRVHVFLKRADNDMRGIIRAKTPPFESVWLSGLEAKDRGPALTSSRKTAASGLLTLRGGNDFLVFCAAPNGTRGVGNHTHNDKLSFCLWAQGEWFLVDPGTGCYTRDPALRNRLRSTAAHTTLMVDGQEQNRIDPGALFSMHDDARVAVDASLADGVVEAQHDGYARIGVVHRRRIARDRAAAWTVSDFIDGQGTHRLKWFFQCAPGMAVEIKNATATISGENGKLVLRASGPHPAPRIEAGLFSPEYGRNVENKVIVFDLDAALPARFAFHLEYMPHASER